MDEYHGLRWMVESGMWVEGVEEDTVLGIAGRRAGRCWMGA
jgi:hypothetical protein